MNFCRADWAEPITSFSAQQPTSKPSREAFTAAAFVTPFIARWPGKIKAGSTSDLPAVFYDMMPTFAEMAGTSVPKESDGVSLLPTLTGKGKQQHHEFLFWDFGGYGGRKQCGWGGKGCGGISIVGTPSLSLQSCYRSWRTKQFGRQAP